MPQSVRTNPLINVADLNQHRATSFDIRPKAEEISRLAEELNLSALKKVSFKGEIKAIGDADWELHGVVGATVTQPCVVTLEPVLTRIDENIERRFLKDMPELEDDDEEVEMPDDENAEPLQATIDLFAVLHESLALLIPLFPRAQDAELQKSIFTEAGKRAMTDEDARPFAGLASLRDKLSPKEDE